MGFWTDREPMLDFPTARIDPKELAMRTAVCFNRHVHDVSIFRSRDAMRLRPDIDAPDEVKARNGEDVNINAL
jgi:hypothetical protein